jgi:predicted polyphosphate/ATP-dependent NAD kinase
MDPEAAPSVGIIVNPASGRDLRRVLGWASVFPNGEKVNVVLRLLAALGQQRIARAWMLADSAGIAARVREAAALARGQRHIAMPEVDLLDLPIRDDARDSIAAAEAMAARGARVIAVLGGDGTHRAVAAGCGNVPLLALSTGTNNAFPELREATLAGLAAGLVARGAVPGAIGLKRHKRLRVQGDGVDAIALVDVAVTRRHGTGARAVWDGDEVSDLYVTFAEPGIVGLASLAGLSQPVPRHVPYGLHLRLGEGRTLHAPLLPGGLQPVAIAASHPLAPGEPVALPQGSGTLAFDGERELTLDPERPLSLTLELDGPWTVAVDAVLAYAAHHGLLFTPPGPWTPPG